MRILLQFALNIAVTLFCHCASAQSNTKGLEITHLKGDYYIYTTYSTFQNEPYPSNSMYLVTEKGVVLFDTPWDSTQFQPLLDSIEKRHHKKVVACIATHFHEDRTAGLTFFKTHGIKTYTSKQTWDLCRENKKNQSEFYFTKDTSFIFGKHKFDTYYAGEGHTKDNIVLWFQDEKILYAGCLIKSTEAGDIGNIEDANLKEYPKTVRTLIDKYPAPSFIIPGHLGWKEKTSREHTLRLLNQ